LVCGVTGKDSEPESLRKALQDLVAEHLDAQVDEAKFSFLSKAELQELFQDSEEDVDGEDEENDSASVQEKHHRAPITTTLSEKPQVLLKKLGSMVQLLQSVLGRPRTFFFVQ
jgi:hypothetical protein